MGTINCYIYEIYSSNTVTGDRKTIEVVQVYAHDIVKALEIMDRLMEAKRSLTKNDVSYDGFNFLNTVYAV